MVVHVWGVTASQPFGSCLVVLGLDVHAAAIGRCVVSGGGVLVALCDACGTCGWWCDYQRPSWTFGVRWLVR